MKSIAVVATEKEYADYLKKNVEKYLGRYARFVSYSVEEAESLAELAEDFVLISAFNIFQRVQKRIDPDSEIIVLSFSLNKRQMQCLGDLPKGTKALLVNFDYRSCMHTITSLYYAGYRDVELFPYYGVGEYDPSIRIAITPNEAHLVPGGIEKVIDVGESSIDLNSLYSIATKLGVYEEFAANEAKEAREEYYYVASSLDQLLSDKESLKDQMNALIMLMKEGIIVTDVYGKIVLSNEKSRRLMSFRSQILNGFYIEDILPELDIKSSEEILIKEDGINLMATSVEIKSGEKKGGYIVTLSDFEEVEKKQHDMRSRMADVGYKARYRFEDIRGESATVRNLIKKAERMAKSDSSVLITGESGTGKELFAQSIHNASARRDYNFVAVNCAAIPDNLLESEMFGYEEGSFTGARKGGHIGYFELAHKGTIFLDEIGEMPLSLQSKLLRVLEEKRVARIGSSRMIEIDVRVIAATNKELPDMIEKGEFREDLYYRLNVLPLHLPALRDHREDIPMLLDYYFHLFDKKIELSQEAEGALCRYAWKGNYRELRNVAEYLSNLEMKEIEESDLPIQSDRACGRTRVSPGGTAPDPGRGILTQFALQEGRNLYLYGYILQAINQIKGRPGRLKICQWIEQKGYPVTEGEVRSGLRALSQYGFIVTGKGRSGSLLTQSGIELMDYIEEIGFIG